MSTDVQAAELTLVLRENIKRRRDQLGLTQAQLAERISAQAPYVSDLETGKRVPVVGSLAKLADALETTPEKLLRENSRF
jgi:HTH-type transcriptional regulator/antitoxin HipB